MEHLKGLYDYCVQQGLTTNDFKTFCRLWAVESQRDALERRMERRRKLNIQLAITAYPPIK